MNKPRYGTKEVCDSNEFEASQRKLVTPFGIMVTVCTEDDIIGSNDDMEDTD